MAPKQPPYAYVRSTYGVNPVPGERAHFTDGREGVIARRASYDQYVWITFDGAKHASPCHPKELTYLGPAGPRLASKPPIPPVQPPRTPEDGHPIRTPEDGRAIPTRRA